jgi:hypothetical protein
MSDPDHPFWKALRGELPFPPAAKLLGWKVLEATPDSGRIRVQYEATSALANPLGNVQGGFLWAGTPWTQPPPTPHALALFGLGTWMFPLWAGRVDRHRTPREAV